MNQILKYIHNYPQETKRIIGITYEQLMKLIDNALIIDTQKKQEIAVQQKRLIKAGGGRKKLSLSQEILLTLDYLHHVPTFQLLGMNFGVSESSANNIFHYWIDIFREFLPESLLEQVKKTKMNIYG